MNKDSRTKNTVRNSSTAFFCKIICLVFSFFARTILIKFLGEEILGIEGLFANIISILSLAELGVTGAVMFVLYKPIKENNEEKTTSIISFLNKFYNIIGIIILIIGLSLTPIIPKIVNLSKPLNNLILYYILTILSTAASYFFAARKNLFIASQNSFINEIIDTICSLFFTSLKIILTIITKNYIIYVGINIFHHIIYNTIIYYYANKKFPFLKKYKSAKLSKIDKSSISIYVKASLAHNIGNVLVQSTDNLLISLFIGTLFVGYYSNYLLIISTVMAFVALLVGSISPSVGNLNAENSDPKKIYSVFQTLNFATFWLVGVTGICLFCLSSEFILIWLKDPVFVLNWPLVLILSINYFINMYKNAPSIFIGATGYFKKTWFKPCLESLINLVSSIIFVHYFGIIGIFLGTTTAHLLTFWIDPFVLYKNLFKEKLFKYFLSYLLRILLFGIIGVVCYFSIKNINISIKWLEWIIKAIVCFSIANLLYLLFYFKNKEFKIIIKRIFKKSKNNKII